MVDIHGPIHSRRLSFWVMFIALLMCAFCGVFILLWIKLPIWAPAWVVEYSPWVDPVVRAAVATTWHQDERFAAEVFSRIKDDRSIAPMMNRILTPEEQSDPHLISSAPPARDLWISPLRYQQPTSVADHLLPHLRTGIEIPYQLIDVAGGIADQRLMEALNQILLQPWKPENLQDARLDKQPTIRAAKALAESPCESAIPILIDSFEKGDSVIRLRVISGILLTVGEGGKFTESDWDIRLKSLILSGITDSESKVRQVAAMGLAWKKIAGVESHLLKMSYATDPHERSAALFALGMRKPGPEAQERIIALLKDPDQLVCLQAIYGTSILDDPSRVTSDLLDLLSSPSEQLRSTVCSVLGRKPHRSDQRVFFAMLTAMDDPSRNVACRAEQAAWCAANTTEQKNAAELKSREIKEKWATTSSP